MMTMGNKIRIGAMSFSNQKGVWSQNVDHAQFRSICSGIAPDDVKEVVRVHFCRGS